MNMKTEDYYKVALDLLWNITSEQKDRIAVELAKRDPKLFCELVGVNDSLTAKIMMASTKAEAIKMFRNVHGSSLKEAMDAVGAVRSWAS